MISVGAESLAILQSDEAEPAIEVNYVVVDGTHSAGKSTLIDSILAESDLVKGPDFYFGGGILSKAGRRYPFYCATRDIDGVKVPIVLSSEMASQYDDSHPGQNVLTDNYNQYDQAAITFRAFFGTQEAASLAAHMATNFQPHRQNKAAMVITDRSPVAGFVYAETRLPEADHRQVDVNAMAEHDGLMLTGVNTPPVPLYAWVSEFMRLCDLVVIPDHHEVSLVDDGRRVMDDELRDAMAANVRQAYTEMVGAEKICDLRGDPEQRSTQFSQYIERLLRTRINL